MKIDENKMEKEEMKNIHAGAEKNPKKAGSKCAFAAGSCCRRANCKPTDANG